MQRTVNQRDTHVLMVGLSQQEWLEEKTWLKSGLQTMHMDWSLASSFAATIEEAVDYVRKYEDLEVVMICGDCAERSRDEMLRAAGKLAKALSEHLHKPWVHLESQELAYLEPIFKAAGLHVVHGMLEHVIFERWQVQIPEEKVA